MIFWEGEFMNPEDFWEVFGGYSVSMVILGASDSCGLSSHMTIDVSVNALA